MIVLLYNEYSKKARSNFIKKWIVEDWEFEITIIERKAEKCRIGLEKGDTFVFQYETPANLCPRVMAEVYTRCKIIRCGGDFTYRGCKKKHKMEFQYPCDCEMFKLITKPFNRD